MAADRKGASARADDDAQQGVDQNHIVCKVRNRNHLDKGNACLSAQNTLI